ncbi:MAG TPA: CoA transferase [Bacillota bacterium]|nr:CoA transferase [Bacillota bacterium]
MPLSSIRILDLTRLLPGPYCTMILADFGADVIKIEQPITGDYARFIGSTIGESSAFFHSLNRNKKSITLDLKSTADRAMFLEMVDEADIIVESFRPGVMKKLGLDYKTLKKRNPQLIYCAITGYGQSGPYKDKPGHDLNYISDAGLLNLMRTSASAPVIPAITIADIAGGALPAAIGILIALINRQNTGEGQFVDIGMMDGAVSLLQTVLPEYLATGVLPKPGEQMLDGGYANYNIYETKDGRYLVVGAIEEKFWRNFCQAIGREDFIPLLYAPLHKQRQLKQEIQNIMSEKSLAEWMEVFSSVEACVSPVNTLEETINNPHVIARKMIQTVTDEKLGKIKHIGIPIKLSKTPGKIRTTAPEFKTTK